jgi:aryl-alcohol dehydrogenase
VFGTGGVGMGGLLAARASRVPVIVAVDPVPGRREAAVRLGATAALDPTAAGDLVEAIVELTGGGASHALETTGLPAVVAQGMRALGTTGTLVAVGMDQAEVTVDIRDMISYGKTLRGCREGDADPQVFLPRLLDLYAAGELPLDALVTRYPFADIERAVADSLAGAAIKPVLVFPAS